LENKEVLRINKSTKELITIASNGKKYVQEGLPEKRFLKVLEHPLTLREVQQKANLDNNELSISLGLLKRNQAINVGEKISVTEKGKQLLQKEFPEEQFLKKLPLEAASLTSQQKQICEELRKRKDFINVDIRKVRTISLTDKGKQLLTMDIKRDYIEAVTPAIIKNQSWKAKPFRRYDVTINVPQVYPAKRHFVNQTINYVRQIWLDMGFTEKTGPAMETAFWNLDALFVPQDHPAREMQDTFFLKDPDNVKLPSEVVKRIKAVHENGGSTGSKGWQAPWSEQLAKKMMLITHDTYLSAKVLASIKKEDLPIKTFQIMKVFRNETVDWKHLFEFYQVGGIVAGEGLNFRQLLGYLKQFFSKMGFDKVRFRPAFFPYTNFSTEVEVFHPIKKQWVELGGAGIFRPEVVQPLVGKDVPVLAWGLGLERILTDYYKITDLRDIYRNDLKQVREMKVWMR
jgi:phenylalanyl-tRNA synthetase alpha chain